MKHTVFSPGRFGKESNPFIKSLDGRHEKTPRIVDFVSLTARFMLVIWRIVWRHVIYYSISLKIRSFQSRFPLLVFFFSVICEYICFTLSTGSVIKKKIKKNRDWKEQICKTIRRPVKIVARRLSISCSVKCFVLPRFPRFLYLTGDRIWETSVRHIPILYAFFLIMLAGSSAFSPRCTAIQSPVRIWRAWSRTIAKSSGRVQCHWKLKKYKPERREKRPERDGPRDERRTMSLFWIRFFTYLLGIRAVDRGFVRIRGGFWESVYFWDLNSRKRATLREQPVRLNVLSENL